MDRSTELWHKTADGDADAVARILEENHGTFSSDLTYSQETDLACIIAASYKWLAELSYTFHRELPEGKGFADIAFRPGAPGCIPVIFEMK